MDPLEYLTVRFHFGGEFSFSDGQICGYEGGSEGLSYIDRDHLSFFEIVGNARDHCRVPDGTRFHWLFPGAEVHEGLNLLTDDRECLVMADSICEGGVAEIYIEFPEDHVSAEDSDFEDELDGLDLDVASEDEDPVLEPLPRASPVTMVVSTSKEEMQRDIDKLQIFYRSPTKKDKGEEVVPCVSTNKGKGKELVLYCSGRPGSVGHESGAHGSAGHETGAHGSGPQGIETDGNGSSSDSDFVLGDDEDSEEDEEGKEILRKFKQLKRKMKKGEFANLDDVVLESATALPAGFDAIEDSGNETPYVTSDDEQSYEEMSDGNLVTKKTLHPRFKKKKDGMPEFALGMTFNSKERFIKEIRKHGLAERRFIRFPKNDKTRVRAVCDWATCPWICLLSKNSRCEGWQIVTYENYHTCPPRRDNRLVTARRIAEKYEKFIMANPSWGFNSMKQTIQEEMFVNVSLSKLKRAKAMVMEKALDACKGQYERLYDYQLELLRSNPGSTVLVHKVPDMEPPTFQRIYICLGALKKGFTGGCRKVIGLDGCFFKGATNGELLCAIGRDANNQMYPIAWAVVEVENKDSWNWFLDILCRDLKVGDGNGWVFISDQQKGIIDAVATWAPEAEHRNCARHIYANWKKHFSNKEWQKKFWKCAKAPCRMLFNLARAKLAQLTPPGAQAIMNTHPQHWSRAWFRIGSNCDSVDNNLCESFNHWILEARFFPIITMLESIRRKVYMRINDQRVKSDRWQTKICPNILKKLNGYIKESGFCHAICNGESKFEVKHYEHRFTVDLDSKECSCRYWQLSGLPCPHAISCIFFKTNILDDHVAECYSVDAFKRTYAHCLLPVEGMSNWPVSDRPTLKAPGYVRMPGRPKKERRREQSEKPKGTKMSKTGTVIKCRKCKQAGHNSATCEKRNNTCTSENNSTPAIVEHNSGKRKATVEHNSAKRKATTTANKEKRCKTSAAGSVMSGPSGSATMNIVASVLGSQASSSVTIEVKNGKASANASASSMVIPNRPTAKKPRPGGMLLLPPWDSAKL